jgi:hypothetical protein
MLDLGSLVRENGRLSLGRVAFWLVLLSSLALVAAVALDRLPLTDRQLVPALLDYFKWLIGLLLGYGGFKRTAWAGGAPSPTDRETWEDPCPNRTAGTEEGRR